MSDPYKRPEGILPNFAHIPTQPAINGTQFHPLYYQHGNLLTQQQQQQDLLQQLQQQQQQQLNQQLIQQQQMLQQPIYANNQYPNPYISPMYQQSMQLPIQPYFGSSFPNPMFYQSLPNPSRPHSPFTELRGSILPPIHPLLHPYPPKQPRGKFGTFSDRIVRYTRGEAATVIQKYWRGYSVRRRVCPILKRSRETLQRGRRRVAVDSVCRSVASELISEAIEVMVVNFVIEWLDFRACLVLLDMECFVLRDRIVDEVITEEFIGELVSECLLEIISAEFYNEIIGEETRDVLLMELSLPRNTLLMRKLTVNDIRDNLFAGVLLDEFIFSELVSHLDEQNYDLSRAREMETLKDGLILSSLISLLEQVDT